MVVIFLGGNIFGYNRNEEYNLSDYYNTEGNNVQENISPTDADHDAALACLGSPWHLPTEDDFKELKNNTDNEPAIINNIQGWKFMKKTDHSVYVFFPAAGTGLTSSDSVERGKYWTSSIVSSYTSDAMYFDITRNVLSISASMRDSPTSVRAVKETT